ncbi:diaminopimelate epimerase [Neorickettsia helminthoeca str. Oregon]|uniref:Diaminopimelate epimerase n=2 Tax=Neorickettsia helminthoeca TaxID=33994 RepID=X5HME8_9RICK|nr:diaminopimelate epimerase [Neorickettsia helminthoeca str. Oregon]
MHACGNDFIIIHNTEFSGIPELDRCETIRRLSSRRTGIGCDQLLIVSNEGPLEAEMIIYNSDGSSAATCLNGAACVALDLMRNNKEWNFLIKSSGGIFLAHLENEKVRIIPTTILQNNLPTKEKVLSKSLSKFSLPGIRYVGIGVSIGNPHLVFFVETEKEVDEIHSFADLVRRNNPFTREINLSVSCIFDGVALSRVIEAGTGETLACGSASAAIYLAARNLGLVETELTIRFPGGDLIAGPHKEFYYIAATPKYVFRGSFWIPF